jgi:hypothetical protein
VVLTLVIFVLAWEWDIKEHHLLFQIPTQPTNSAAHEYTSISRSNIVPNKTNIAPALTLHTLAMAFGRSTNADRTAAPGTDYGTPAVRSNKLHRPLLAANHALHTISSIIVLGISAYFINDYTHNTHLRYWVALVRPPSHCTLVTSPCDIEQH